MFKIETVLTLGKSMTTKITKDDGGSRVAICVAKFADLEVKDRDILDELIGMPLGWCQSRLYDELGAPLRRFGLQVFGRQHRVSGTIAGPKEGQVLSLLQAELTDCDLRLIPLGAMVSGTLTWSARGDEVEDVAEILGMLCVARWEVHEGGQDDMFAPTSKHAAESQRETQRVLDELAARRGNAQPGQTGAAP